MKPEEKLRKMMLDYAHNEKGSAMRGDHLRDEDFIRLIEAESPGEENSPTETNGKSISTNDELASLRAHLAICAYCLAQFKDYYAFFAPAGSGEVVAGKKEVDAAWQAFVPRIPTKEEAPQKEKQSFWAWLFPAERNPGYLAAFGWSLAALLLISTAVSVFVALQARDEKAQLAAQLENQKQTSEERLKTLEQSSQNRDLAEQEKTRLAEEKGELQKQIAQLKTEIERAKQETKTEREKPSALSPTTQATPDNSLVAVNTPIYDVFPAEAVVRGNGQSQNKFAVPNAARNVVLILNAAGSADFSTYQAELINNAGKTIWRGAGLKKDNLGNFTLTLVRSALKPGNYRLRLFGKNGATSQVVAEYPVTIEIGK